MQPNLALLTASLLALVSSAPTAITDRDVGTTYPANAPYSIRVLSTSGATDLYSSDDNEQLLGAWMTQMNNLYSNSTAITDVTGTLALEGGATLAAQLASVDGVTINDVSLEGWTWMRGSLRDANDRGEGRPERATYMVEKDEKDMATFAVSWYTG